jgi:hypothetical protein
MVYMFKVFIVVALPVFGLAGAALLALMAWSEAKQYARGRLAIQRIAAVASRERLAISRTDSRNRDARSLHVA